MFCETADNVDALLRKVYERLLSGHPDNHRVKSRKGDSTEVFGASLELTNPRARVSRSEDRARIFSAIGELAWYLAGSNAISFIEYYLSGYKAFSDDGLVANGAYGVRIFQSDSQWKRAISTLRARPGSRNAVIQIFSNSDAERESKDIPCTCVIQMVVRNDHLYWHTHMRSNDAYRGMPNDIFSFTMLQEIAARELGCELGCYTHSVGSLHLYDDDADCPSRTNADRYLKEAIFEAAPMPPMPVGDPWGSIQEFLFAEQRIREGDHDYKIGESTNPYWADLVRLLKVYSLSRGECSEDARREVVRLMDELTCKELQLYVLDRLAKRLTAGEGLADFVRDAR